jgi:hypothetical protein
LTNAGAITICPDDLIRLFVSWIERYHEAHFAVIKEIYQKQSVTKGEIWDNIHPAGRPADNSSEGGLFSYLMRELNLGGVIEIEKEVNYLGQKMRATQRSRRTSGSSTMESPFEDSKSWVLTELGKEFVRYVLEGAITQIGDKSTTAQNE